MPEGPAGRFADLAPMPLQGSLQNLGLADLLQNGLGGQSAGTLTLRNGARRAALYVSEEGLHLLEPEVLEAADLLDAFVARGLLARAAVDRSLRKHQTPSGALPGLVASGALPEEEVLEVLAGVAEDCILDLLTWDQGEFRYEEGPLDPRSLTLAGQSPVDIGGVLLRAAQRIDERADIARGVGLAATLFCPLPGGPPPSQEEGDLAPSVYECLNGQRLLEEVALLLGIGRFQALKAAFSLVAAGRARVATPEELERAAGDRLRNREFRAARSLLQQWAEADPTHPAPIRHMIHVASAQSRREEELDALCWLAHLLRGGGKPAAAVVELRQGLQRHPGDARLLAALRDAAEAATDVEAFAESTTKLAEVLLRGGDPSRAASLLEPIVEANPQSLPLRVLRARALLRASERDGFLKEVQAVLRLLGRRCQTAEERETAAFFRDAVAGAAPNRSDLLRRLTHLAARRQGRDPRLALAAALLLLVAVSGVVLWPPSPRTLLDRAEAAFHSGERMKAQDLVSELIERHPRSAEAEAAYTLQSRLLDRFTPRPHANRPGDESEIRSLLARQATEVLRTLGDLPHPAARQSLAALASALESPEGAGQHASMLARLDEPLRQAMNALTRQARERADILAQIPDVPDRWRENPEPLRAFLVQARAIAADSFAGDGQAALAVVTRLVRAQPRDAVSLALQQCGAALRHLEATAQEYTPFLVDVERALLASELREIEGVIRERTPALVVNGHFDQADALYKKMDDLIAKIQAEPLHADLRDAIERRRLPLWLKQKRERMAEVREGIRAAQAAEAAGDLPAAARAYVGLIRRYEYIRFETVFSLPLEVRSIPASVEVLVNGVVAGRTPLVVRYGWGTQTTVTCRAEGFETQAILLRTAELEPQTTLTVHLHPTVVWTADGEPGIQVPPLRVGQDVLTVDRSGRVTRYEGPTGKVLWARHYKSLEGVTSRPAMAGGWLHVALVNGDLHVLDPRDGNPTGHLKVGRPTGDLASLEDTVAVATLKREVVGVRSRRVAWRTPLPADPTTGVLAAGGAFWVGTAQGDLVRIDPATGAARTLRVPPAEESIRAIGTMDGGVLVTTANGRLAACEFSPSLRWAKDALGDLVGAPCQAGDLVAASDRRGRLLLFAPSDGTPHGAVEMGAAPHGGVASDQGCVVAHLEDGRLWVLDTDTRAVGVDVPLKGNRPFPAWPLGGGLLAANVDGAKLALLRLPAPPRP